MDLVQKGLISILVVHILSTFAITGYSGMAASPLQGGRKGEVFGYVVRNQNLKDLKVQHRPISHNKQIQLACVAPECNSFDSAPRAKLAKQSKRLCGGWLWKKIAPIPWSNLSTFELGLL
ncbi:hypothetical protein T484DRAFT_1936476 [Baffinella frigidus]|nr:hypothetical protein T484DRAFT_1936476 [Cryptophyta sp. CCMP2293]